MRKRPGRATPCAMRCAPQRDLAPQTRGPILPAFCSFGLLWPVMALACGSLHTAVTSVPSGWHIAHWLLTNSRRLPPCWSAADLRQTRPVCSPDESRSRRYSAKASRSMPEPPSKQIYTTEGWRVDQTRPDHLFPCFSRLSVCSACICERLNHNSPMTRKAPPAGRLFLDLSPNLHYRNNAS
jgi:hypothetical protein